MHDGLYRSNRAGMVPLLTLERAVSAYRRKRIPDAIRFVTDDFLL